MYRVNLAFLSVAENTVDLVTLDKPFGSSECAGNTLASQRKATIPASGEPGLSSLV